MADLADLFPGFESHWIDVSMGRIFARSAGDGPPIVLLHGFPQTHVCWHLVAPLLAKTHRVVCMDMRGYGWSSAPESRDGALYAKRAMAADVVEAMSKLGHARFAFAGHDRGARIGYRLALDEPGRIERLALLDILPTFRVWLEIQAGRQAARHWEFLAKPAPEPETEIAKDPIGYVDGLLSLWNREKSLAPFDPRALAHYHASGNEPSRIHAYCEDYRAGATLDVEADEADLAAGRKIACPVLVLTGRFYLTGGEDAALAAWRESFAPQAVSASAESGHFLAEEAPEATAAALAHFLASPG
ncbi:haloacetate dehalogenase [Rhizobiales bacterium GAS191]|jgi:haloacetate dehalogenase|nr:haloacetate dehalogenase [Rhizobiales bacterium GAS188]SEE89982.1 haloacetate dehalogenase [Rhizobiales bacterium GAS191]